MQEYEKRLLAKDHDLKCSQAQLEHVRHELSEAKKVQAEGSNLLPAPEAHEGASCHPCSSPSRCGMLHRLRSSPWLACCICPVDSGLALFMTCVVDALSLVVPAVVTQLICDTMVSSKRISETATEPIAAAAHVDELNCTYGESFITW